MDFGSVYASKTFQLRDGRRVLLGWVYETAAGCEAECSTGTNFTYSLVSDGSFQHMHCGFILHRPHTVLGLRMHTITTCMRCARGGRVPTRYPGRSGWTLSQPPCS